MPSYHCNFSLLLYIALNSYFSLHYFRTETRKQETIPRPVKRERLNTRLHATPMGFRAFYLALCCVFLYAASTVVRILFSTPLMFFCLLIKRLIIAIFHNLPESHHLLPSSLLFDVLLSSLCVYCVARG